MGNFILEVFAAFSVIWAANGLICKNNGVVNNDTTCDCTATCYGGDICEQHNICGYPPSVQNSTYEFGETIHNCKTTVTYRCQRGYVFPGRNVSPNGTKTVTCDGTRWSAPPSGCVRIICPVPPLDARTSHLDGPKSVYYSGDTIIFHCNDLRDLYRHETRTCGMDGTWSGDPPSCTVNFIKVLLIGLMVAAFYIFLVIFLMHDFVKYHRKTRRIHANMHRRINPPNMKQYHGMAGPTKQLRRMSTYTPSIMMKQAERMKILVRIMKKAGGPSHSDTELSGLDSHSVASFADRADKGMLVGNTDLLSGFNTASCRHALPEVERVPLQKGMSIEVTPLESKQHSG